MLEQRVEGGEDRDLERALDVDVDGTAALVFGGGLAPAVAGTGLAGEDFVFERDGAPVGRMALSAYVAQTAIGVLIFFGVGLGLLGRFGNSVTMPLGVAVFALQVWACRAWLARFQDATLRGSGSVEMLPPDLITSLDRRGREPDASHDARTVAGTDASTSSVPRPFALEPHSKANNSGYRETKCRRELNIAEPTIELPTESGAVE